MLRAIRFASRYDFKLDRDLIDAALNPSVHHALLHKVSRERVLNELTGMMGSNSYPWLALHIIYRRVALMTAAI